MGNGGERLENALQIGRREVLQRPPNKKRKLGESPLEGKGVRRREWMIKSLFSSAAISEERERQGDAFKEEGRKTKKNRRSGAPPG